LPVATFERVNAEPFLSKVAGGSDGIVCGFNQIFRAPLISKFRTLTNCHPSVLPFYRGPMPSHWCIRNGETRSGYTLHAVTERIDAGEILFQEAVAIDPSDDADALNERIMRRAAIALESYMECLVHGRSFRRVRLDAHSVYRHHVDYASFPDNDQNLQRHKPSGRG
jgi:methionyl-tRNA formyltransferase